MHRWNDPQNLANMIKTTYYLELAEEADSAGPLEVKGQIKNQVRKELSPR